MNWKIALVIYLSGFFALFVEFVAGDFLNYNRSRREPYATLWEHATCAYVWPIKAVYQMYVIGRTLYIDISWRLFKKL